MRLLTTFILSLFLVSLCAETTLAQSERIGIERISFHKRRDAKGWVPRFQIKERLSRNDITVVQTDQFTVDVRFNGVFTDSTTVLEPSSGPVLDYILEQDSLGLDIRLVLDPRFPVKMAHYPDRSTPHYLIALNYASPAIADEANLAENTIAVSSDIEAQEKLERERLLEKKRRQDELKQVLADQAEKARLRKEEQERERIAQEEKAAQEKLQERIDAQKAVAEEEERLRLEKEEEDRLEKERLAKIEADKVATEKAEQVRLEEERLETERLAKIEADKVAAEKAEQERLEKERLETERLAKIEADRVAAEKAEQARLEALRLAEEAKENERLEEERRKEIEAKEKQEQIRLQNQARIKAEKEAAQRFQEDNARYEEEQRRKTEAADKEKEEIVVQKSNLKKAAEELKEATTNTVDHWKLDCIVIDAGHGGTDPGTEGNGILEKDVNLAVAKKLGKMISDNLDIRVIYTRNTDVLVPLDKRGPLGNLLCGKLFVSLHSNGHWSKEAVGTESYFLGLNYTEAAREVMERENQVVRYESTESNNIVQPMDHEKMIRQTLMQSAFLRESQTLSSIVQREFEKSGRISRGVKQAGFVVLYTATMPAILVELGFLSNQEEALYLSSEKGQAEMAQSLYAAIAKYKGLYEQALDEVSSTE